MPTNIQTVEISGDYEPIKSFGAFKKLLRNLFTSTGPMFSFLESEDISVNTFDSGYITGNRVYVSLTGGISYLFEIVGDIYTDITQVEVPPEEPPDEVVPSSGRLITKVSPEVTTVPLTAASNYVAVDPIETPIVEDETLSGLGIYSDRPALLSITQHAYSEELFELIKEYRMSKIQECKSKIDGLDPKIRAKLKKEYTEEIQKVNSLISFANDYLDNKVLLKEKESDLIEKNTLLSNYEDILEQISSKNDLLKLEKDSILSRLHPDFEPTLLATVIATSPNSIFAPLFIAATTTDLILEIPSVTEEDNKESIADKITKINSIISYFNLVKIYSYFYTDPTKISEWVSEYGLLSEFEADPDGFISSLVTETQPFIQLIAYIDYQELGKAAGFATFDSWQIDLVDTFENAKIIEVIKNLEEQVRSRKENLVSLKAIFEIEEQLPDINKKILEEDILQLQEHVEFLENFLLRPVQSQNLSNYSGLDEIFELPGFDLGRFTSFLSEQELITIQRQKQMYQANSAIGFLPKKELQVYNEMQWYLLKRYAEFLSKLDNPRLITFGIPSNAEEELGELIAAEIRIQPEDPIPFGKNIKFEGPIFLYNKDLFLVMRDDFDKDMVDYVFENTTNFLSFREKFGNFCSNFFNEYKIDKNGITETTSYSSSPVDPFVFRDKIIDFYESFDSEPPLSIAKDVVGQSVYKRSSLQIKGGLVSDNDLPFTADSTFVNHGIDILTKELYRIYGGTVVDEDSFPLDDESQTFVISSTAIDSIESLSSDGFDSNIPLPETMSDPVLMSQLVSPQNSVRKICSDKVFSRTFSTFIDEQMFPVTTTSALLYDTDGTGTTKKWKRTADSPIFKWQSGPDSGNPKYIFYKTTNFTSNRRTGNMQIVIYHNGDTGIEIP